MEVRALTGDGVRRDAAATVAPLLGDDGDGGRDGRLALAVTGPISEPAVEVVTAGPGVHPGAPELLVGEVLAGIAKDVSEDVADAAASVDDVVVKAAGKDAAALAPHDAIHALGNADGDALHGAGKGGRVVRLHEEVEMISHDGEVKQAETLVLAPSLEGASDDAEARRAAEIHDVGADAERDEDGALFPTGNLVDDLAVPGVGTLRATLINAGIPTIFVNAEDIGYTGTELQEAINGDAQALATFETIRAHGAVRMGLIDSVEQAAARQHTPKVAFVAPARDYRASSGKQIHARDIDLNVRALSMGKLHHAMMGTAAVAIGTAAAIPGTLVNLAAGGGDRDAVTFGHPSGTLRVGAGASRRDGSWAVDKVVMSRSARVLMEGWVRIPGDAY